MRLALATVGFTSTIAQVILMRELVATFYGNELLFGLVLWLINFAGYSVMLGWLITTPLTLAAAGAAYRDVFGLEGAQQPVEQQPEQV